MIQKQNKERINVNKHADNLRRSAQIHKLEVFNMMKNP